MPVLKDEKDGALLTSRRRLFQSAGMQDEKGRSPQFSGRLNTVLCSRKLSIGTLRNYDGDDNPPPPPPPLLALPFLRLLRRIPSSRSKFRADKIRETIP